MNHHDDPNRPASQPLKEEEVSNVDLQFMGRTDVKRDVQKEERAEAKLADEFAERGLDPQDVASAGSMVASDPASTHMPADESETSKTER